MISLSREIVGFVNSICQETRNEDIPMIAVYDYINTDGLYGTDAVYWDAERSSLSVMHVDKSTNSAFSTLRTSPILSGDINADTYVEIPVQENIIGSSLDEKRYNSALTYTKWCSLIPENDGIKLEQSGGYRLYFTYKDYLEINSSLLSGITVLRNTKTDVWSIMSYNKENLEESKILISVCNINFEETDKYISSGYKQLSSNSTDNKIIVYKITDDGKNMGFVESNLINVNLCLHLVAYRLKLQKMKHQ